MAHIEYYTLNLVPGSSLSQQSYIPFDSIRMGPYSRV